MAEIKQIKLPNGNTYDIYDAHALRKYHNLEINWEQQTDFIPSQGELIVYDIDNTHSYERLKIGDGATNVNSLPFVVSSITNAEIDTICGTTIQLAEDVTL